MNDIMASVVLLYSQIKFIIDWYCNNYHVIELNYINIELTLLSSDELLISELNMMNWTESTLNLLELNCVLRAALQNFDFYHHWFCCFHVYNCEAALEKKLYCMKRNINKSDNITLRSQPVILRKSSYLNCM